MTQVNCPGANRPLLLGVLEVWARRWTQRLSLPLVVGKGAGERAKDFIALLKRYPQVWSQTRAIAWPPARP